jgi:tRNA threonylcarbamoyladenosine biosynthesis protein TsaE
VKISEIRGKIIITMNIVFSLDQIQEVAQQILASNPKKIILFNGEMGVGKTTLIKQLCKSLGVQDATSSPTFSLVNEYYTSDNKIVYHFDFYRLNKETEALDMGVDDYLYSGNWCFIEWSEKIANLLPDDYSTINIKLLADGKRELELA